MFEHTTCLILLAIRFHRVYQPYVWKYSRLNITSTVISKHKLNRLVTEKCVDRWDDPRLMTLAGL